MYTIPYHVRVYTRVSVEDTLPTDIQLLSENWLEVAYDRCSSAAIMSIDYSTYKR